MTSNGRSRSPSKTRSPKGVHRKQRAEPNRDPINMRNRKLEKTPSSNSTGNSDMALNVGVRNLVARLRGSPRPRPPKQTFENLIFEEYGPHMAPPKAPQRAYEHYYKMANVMSKRNNVQQYVQSVGNKIPNEPELQRPSRPRYQGQRAGQTSRNKVLHTYPQLLPLFFKPNNTFSPIVTPYLQNRRLAGYTFFPPYPNRTRRQRGRSRSGSSSGSSSGSNF